MKIKKKNWRSLEKKMKAKQIRKKKKLSHIIYTALTYVNLTFKYS